MYGSMSCAGNALLRYANLAGCSGPALYSILFRRRLKWTFISSAATTVSACRVIGTLSQEMRAQMTQSALKGKGKR